MMSRDRGSPVGSGSSLRMAPLRSLDDFVMSGARFSLPDPNDSDRWMNRIQSNLLYYQSNYLLVILMVFLVVTLLHPQGIITGLLGVGGIGYVLLFQRQQLQQLLQQPTNRLPLIALSFMALFVLSKMFNALLVVSTALFVSMALCLMHASLRMRNLKNKLSNVSDAIEPTTPMAKIFQTLGIQQQIKYHIK